MRIFQMKAKPHGNDRLSEFLTEGFVCIGWPHLGDLNNTPKVALRDLIEEKYEVADGKLRYALGQVSAFVHTMQPGDIVLLREKEWVHEGVVGEYIYEPQFDNDIDGMCHRRKVEWGSRHLFTDLNAEMQRFMGNRHTICEYPGSLEDSGLSDTALPSNTLTGQAKSRLHSLMDNALSILEEELQSDNPDRRLKAATELLRLKKGVAMRGFWLVMILTFYFLH